MPTYQGVPDDGLGFLAVDDFEEVLEFEDTTVGDGVPDPNSGQDPKVRDLHFKRDAASNLKIHDEDPVEGQNRTDETKDPYRETLVIPPYRDTPETCSENCARQDWLARQHCDMIRKRVAQWMKDSGCPSSVRGFKRKTKCGRSRFKSVAFYDVDGDGRITANDFPVDDDEDGFDDVMDYDLQQQTGKRGRGS